jgi:hypothetical protein
MPKSLPLRVGLIFAAAGIILAIVGIIRGTVPAQPLSILLALLISGGSWGVVSWAVTTAIVDVEADRAEEAPHAPAQEAAHDERG